MEAILDWFSARFGAIGPVADGIEEKCLKLSNGLDAPVNTVDYSANSSKAFKISKLLGLAATPSESVARARSTLPSAD